MPETLSYGVTYTVEAALSAAVGTYGAWGAGLWDTATWGPDEIWVDISRWVRSIRTERKFSREVAFWEAGTASLDLMNFDGRFSPWNLAGPYVTAGITGVRPWRPIRIRAAWAGITYDVWRGYALDWVEYYDQAGPNSGGAYVQVPCIDELGALARFDGLAVTPVGAGELSGARVHRILNAAGHIGMRTIDAGQNTMQATDLSANTVEGLKLVVDSEGGGLFVDKAGTVVFQRQYALMENVRSSTVQSTWGDGGGTELPYSDVTLGNDGDLLVNIAAFQRVGGTVQIATNETSRALYRDKRTSRTDLICQTDAQAFALATFAVTRLGDFEQRIKQIEVKPRNNPVLLFPRVLGHEVRDLVRVYRRPPGHITMIRDCHISGISHVITGDNWITTFDLSSAAVYQTYATSRFDVGTWDASAWFF